MLAGIVESSDDAIISKNLNGIITSWNAGAERVFGHTAAEAIGQSIGIIIPAERQHEEVEIIQRLRQGETIEHFETERVAKDGRYVPISITVSPVRNRQGVVIGASKIAHDITARLRAEEERARLLASEQAARAQADEANRAKDEFLATASMSSARRSTQSLVGRRCSSNRPRLTVVSQRDFSRFIGIHARSPNWSTISWMSPE